MRREYHMSNHEFWHELSLARLCMLMELNTERMMAERGFGRAQMRNRADEAAELDALDFAGL